MTSLHRSAEWAAMVRKLRPVLARQVDSGTGVCVNCGQLIYPGERWAVGHRMDASLYPEHALSEWNLGPTHHGKKGGRTCNQKAGGRIGAARTNNAKKRKTTGEEYPKW